MVFLGFCGDVVPLCFCAGLVLFFWLFGCVFVGVRLCFWGGVVLVGQCLMAV